MRTKHPDVSCSDAATSEKNEDVSQKGMVVTLNLCPMLPDTVLSNSYSSVCHLS